MSLIGVSGIPMHFSIDAVTQFLKKAISGEFEVVNFKKNAQSTKSKGCCLLLSEKLDPAFVVEKINRIPYYNKSTGRWTAKIPAQIPDVPLSTVKALSKPLRHELKTRVLIVSHYEILSEMQSKFTGLFNISKKTGHKLLEEIAQTVLKRMKDIIKNNHDSGSSGGVLTKAYRVSHPHFADFQFILSTLHKIEDAKGTPRTQIVEAELTKVGPQLLVLGIENIPYNKVQEAYIKFSSKIETAILNHVKNLKTDPEETDTEEEVARKRVRRELKKLVIYLPEIVKEVSMKSFKPDSTQKDNCQRIRIYGEPSLPSKEQLNPLLARFKTFKVTPPKNMYNLIRLSITPSQYSSLIAMDGTVVGGSKLVIRPSHQPVFDIPEYLLSEMKAAYGNVSADRIKDEEVSMLEDYIMVE